MAQAEDVERIKNLDQIEDTKTFLIVAFLICFFKKSAYFSRPTVVSVVADYTYVVYDKYCIRRPNTYV
jgi:hypothetical protein